VDPVRQLQPGTGRQRDLPVDACGLAASVVLRHLPHAQQRVRPAPQRQLLEAAHLGVVPCLRRLEDSLPQPSYVLLMDPPVNGVPVEGGVPWSVHSNGPSGRYRRLSRRRVHLALRFQRLGQSSSTAHPAHVSTLSGPSVRSVSGQLCGAAGVRPDSRVPVAFRPAGVGFLGHPVPAKEFSSPCGRLTGHAPPGSAASGHMRR
jgi:hypothetical protein